MAKEQTLEIERARGVMFRITPTLDRLLEIHAAEVGISKSNAINRAIRQYLGLAIAKLPQQEAK